MDDQAPSLRLAVENRGSSEIRFGKCVSYWPGVIVQQLYGTRDAIPTVFTIDEFLLKNPFQYQDFLQVFRSWCYE